MWTGSGGDGISFERLSAMVDGELDDAELAQVCSNWSKAPSARATWHAYQLIGDVLRSEDLTSTSERDAAFLNVLRARLASEPVVLAPSSLVAPMAGSARPVRAPVHRRWSWMASSTVAAGFVAVAGVLVVTRDQPPTPSSLPGAGMATIPAALAPEMPALSSAPGAAQNSPNVAVALPAVPISEPMPRIADGQLARDADLDRYLAAHKHFAGSAALGVPSAYLRSATVNVSGR